MNYLRDKDSIFTSGRNVKKNTKSFLIVSVLVIFFTYIILFTNVFGVLVAGAGAASGPMWKFQNYISGVYDNIYSSFTSKKILLAKNKRLEEEIEIASAKLLDRNLLFEENIELKELLGRDLSSELVFASVLARPNRTLYDTLIIDVGRNVGVQKGDKVLYGGNILIGEISEVLEGSAKALLYSSPGEKLNVSVGVNSITSVAHGRGGGNFELKLPRDAKVDVGDVASVLNINPRVLGTVEYINESPSDPFKTILLSGPVNIFKLKWVEVELQQ